MWRSSQKNLGVVPPVGTRSLSGSMNSHDTVAPNGTAYGSPGPAMTSRVATSTGSKMVARANASLRPLASMGASCFFGGAGERVRGVERAVAVVLAAAQQRRCDRQRRDARRWSHAVGAGRKLHTRPATRPSRSTMISTLSSGEREARARAGQQRLRIAQPLGDARQRDRRAVRKIEQRRRRRVVRGHPAGGVDDEEARVALVDEADAADGRFAHARRQLGEHAEGGVRPVVEQLVAAELVEPLQIVEVHGAPPGHLSRIHASVSAHAARQLGPDSNPVGRRGFRR